MRSASVLVGVTRFLAYVIIARVLAQITSRAHPDAIPVIKFAYHWILEQVVSQTSVLNRGRSYPTENGGIRRYH